ncbi:MAG: Arm DNA-binding domain-containing protein, partial [Alphaproteobacteria bacterium]|nr:Arm DNA-binding domain-containing protein [Alphaproteobacteria bacterium]
MKLTDTSCKNAKAKEKAYKLTDGGGMYLEVMPHGSKLWRLKYRYQGKENRIALGSYPETSLKEAREKR